MGEENGYLGSYACASAMRNAGENIVAVFNLDMPAYDRKGGPVVDMNMRAPGDSPLDGPLADVFQQIVGAYRINRIPERQYQTRF
jgi:Zn-dependent M28 family amino/carboxypeptidase